MAGNLGYFLMGLNDGMRMYRDYELKKEQMNIYKRRIDLQEKTEKRLQRQAFLREKLATSTDQLEREKTQAEIDKIKAQTEKIGRDTTKEKKPKEIFGAAIDDKYYDPEMKSVVTKIYNLTGEAPQTAIETKLDANGKKKFKSVFYITSTGNKVDADNLLDLYREYPVLMQGRKTDPMGFMPETAELAPQGTDIMPLPDKGLGLKAQGQKSEPQLDALIDQSIKDVVRSKTLFKKKGN